MLLLDERLCLSFLGRSFPVFDHKVEVHHGLESKVTDFSPGL